MRKVLFSIVLVVLLIGSAGVDAQVHVGDYVFSHREGTFQSIASTGTYLNVLNADNGWYQVALPFEFPFGMEEYATITIMANGDVGMGYITNHSYGYDVIYVIGTDLDMANSGAIYYEMQQTASGRVAVVEYSHVRPWGDRYRHCDCTAQVRLYENGDVEIVYDTCEMPASRDIWVGLDEPGWSALFITDNWTVPRTSSAEYSQITLSSTQHPEPGHTFSFCPMVNCLAPTQFRCTASDRGDSVRFTWRPSLGMRAWEVRYDLANTPLNVMRYSSGILTDTAYVCTTMQDSVEYDVYVGTVCDDSGSRQWAGPVRVMPHYYICGNGRDTILACDRDIYYSTRYAPFGGDAMLIIRSNIPGNMVVLSGRHNMSYDTASVRVFDGEGTRGTLLYANSDTGAIPPIRSLDGVLTVYISSMYRNDMCHSVELHASCEPMAACRRVTRLEVSNISGTSAYLSWSTIMGLADPEEYVVTCYNLDDTTLSPIVLSAFSHSILAQGLLPSTRYRAVVNGICNEEDEGDTVEFATYCLSGGDTRCRAASPSTVVPVNDQYPNTMTQSIYTAEDLRNRGLTPGSINGMAYSWNGVGTDRRFEIYISHTDLTVFSQARAVWDTSMVPLYSGIRHAGDTGRNEYLFSTPFVWDGEHGLLVTTFMNRVSDTDFSPAGFTGYASYTDVHDSLTLVDSRYYPYTPTSLYEGYPRISCHRVETSFLRPCDNSMDCVAPNVVLTSVDATEAAIEWAPGNGEAQWSVWRRADADSVWTLVDTNVTETHYLFVGLEPRTSYVLKVEPHCVGYYAYDTVHVLTGCAAIDELPYYEDFEFLNDERYENSSLLPCWHLFEGVNMRVHVAGLDSYTGSNSLIFNYDLNSSTGVSYAVLPQVNADVSGLQVSFYARTYVGDAAAILVGIMTDLEDFTTFEAVDTVTPIGNWAHFNASLSGYSGNGQYIALSHLGNGVFIDDLEVSVNPDCDMPTHVLIVDAGVTQATLSWRGSSATYEVEYGPRGFASGTGTRLLVAADSVVISGLEPAASYEAHVRACCPNDSSRWSEMMPFNTLCGQIDRIPYAVNFASGQRSQCWTYGGSINYPYVVVSSDVRENEHVLVFRSIPDYNYAIMPAIDSQYPIEHLQVRFRAWSRNLGTPFIVGLCRRNISLATFTPIDTLMLSSTPCFYDVLFDAAAGYGQYVAFVVPPDEQYPMVNIDTIVIDTIPSCLRPSSLAVLSVGEHDAVVTWHERGNAAAWAVEYGPYGFVQGTGICDTVYADTITLTGLADGAAYDFYVRSLCTASLGSEWSLVGHLMTQQQPAVLPYCCDFEDTTELALWQRMNRAEYAWEYGYAAGSSHSLYISPDSGVTFPAPRASQNNSAVVYRDIDFGSVDTSVTITFRARLTGYGQMLGKLDVIVADPSRCIDLASIISPWADDVEVQPVLQLATGTSWNQYTVTLDSVSGIHRLLFWWRLPNGDSGHGVAIDDICVVVEPCPRPSQLRLTSVSQGTADVAWYGPENALYEATLRSNNGLLISIDTIATNSIHYELLTAFSTYKLSVCRLCDSGSTSQPSEPFLFTVLGCDENGNVAVGDVASTTVSQTLPLDGRYNNSYTQQIVKASELDGPGTIKGIRLYYNDVLSMRATHLRLYLAHVQMEHFDSASFYDMSTFQDLVYDGDFNCEHGWNTVNFDHPFHYNGTDNLLVTMQSSVGYYQQTENSFKVSPTGELMAVSHVTDGSYMPGSPYFTGSSNIYALRNVMLFDVCPLEECPAPQLRMPYVRYEGVTLRWHNTGAVYLFSYRRSDQSRWIVEDEYTLDTTYVTPMLYPHTDYVYVIRQICDALTTSNAAMGTFNSSDLGCLPPLDFSVSDVKKNSAAFRWSSDENHVSYQVRIFNSFYDDTLHSYITHNATNELSPGVTYHAAMRVRCEDEGGSGSSSSSDDGYWSFWSDTISFTTPMCSDVADVEVTEVGGNSAVVSWTESGSAQSWQIEWGPYGFNQGTGTMVTVTSQPYTITGLIGETEYEVYVRAICDTDFVSEHWSGTTFTTMYSGLDEAGEEDCVTLFPNPASGRVRLSLPQHLGIARVEILDMRGCPVKVYNVPAFSIGCTLDVGTLRAGAYYVRVVGNDVTFVRKLIVR